MEPNVMRVAKFSRGRSGSDHPAGTPFSPLTDDLLFVIEETLTTAGRASVLFVTKKDALWAERPKTRPMVLHTAPQVGIEVTAPASTALAACYPVPG